MDFYHDLVTQKSWQVLQNLRRKYDFILIGGWAVFLYTGAAKSKDIDIVMEYEILSKLKDELPVSKNDRLKKYEAREETVEIDIYVPFWSNPGLPAEDLKNYVLALEGFKVVEKEVLVILKLKALKARAGSVKGRKDLIDLLSLLVLSDFNWDKYKNIVTSYKLVDLTAFASGVISETMEIAELDLNKHQMARLKKQILPHFKF